MTNPILSPLFDRTGRFSLLKSAVFGMILLPGVGLLIGYWTGGLGPLAIKGATLETGDWAIRFLVAALALTPAQRILALPRLALVRRMVGVASFAYAFLHLVLFVVDHKFNLATVASEIALRVYLTIGCIALLGLAALAATSTDAAIHRLGRRWKMLHRIVYGIAVLAIVHFFMQSKIDASQATLMAGFALLLMLYRCLIAARLGLAPMKLAAAAVAGASLTAAVETAWYGLATGIDPWRVALANLDPRLGIRPAVIVLLAGLALSLIAWLRVAGQGLARRPSLFLRNAT